MARRKKWYVMTKGIYAKLKGKGAGFVCPRCGKELKVGDKIVPRVHGGTFGRRTRRFHKKCWEEMFFVKKKGE